MLEPQADGSKLRSIFIAIAVVLLGLGGMLVVNQPEPTTTPSAGPEAAMRVVSTLPVRSYAIRPQAEVSGVLEARRTVKLFAETVGPVVEVGAEELDSVEEGQVLVRLDPVLAEAAVARAEAMLAKAKSQLALASSNLKRQRQLFERNVVSDATLDDYVNGERVAEASLKESQAELRRARDDLENKLIRAPFDGVLRTFSVEVGEYLQTGQLLGELLDQQTVRVTVGVTDRELVAVEPGQPVRVYVEAYPNQAFDGRVLRVGAAADEQTKKFPVEVELPNPDRGLLAGMVVRVSLDLGEPQPRTVVPREATVDEFGLRFVYVVEPENGTGGYVANRRRIQVRPLAFRPGEFEVVSGIEEGEEIATTGVRQLRDGERVLRKGKDRK